METGQTDEKRGATVAAPAPPPERAVVAGANPDSSLQVGSLRAPRAERRGPALRLLEVFVPNRAVSPHTMRLIVTVELAIAVLVWLNSPFKVLPRPDEVFQALRGLWFEQGLGPELLTSFKLNLEALGWSTLISLGLAYLTVIPVFRPVVAAVARGRFLSLAGFSFIFTVLVGGGHPLKLWLMVFGVTVFYVTSMAAVIAAIPRGEFDHARTLRMREWRVVWEVVVLGTADKAFEVLRQNAAIGWMMLTMVEGISRSEGGVGALLLSQTKFFRLADVFAIQLVILIVGLIQDYVIGAVRRLACPYADLTLERS